MGCRPCAVKSSRIARLKPRMIDLPHVASRVFGTPLMIARAKLEVILGVLAPRLSGSVAEPVDTQADPAPQTSITVERIAVVSRASRTRSQSDRRDHRQPERQNDRSWRTARLRRRQKDQRAQRRADQAATRAAEHFLILSILFRRRHAGAPALWCGGSQA